MSRFSPQVQEREGPDLGAMITQAFMQHRQQKRQDADDAFTEKARARTEHGWQRQDEDREQNEAVEAASRYDAGFRRRDQVQTTTDAPGMAGVAVRGLDGQALARPADRYERFGELYRDPDATPQGIERRRNRAAYDALDPSTRGAYADGVDYLGQIGEQLKFNRDLKGDDHETANDLKVVGVEQTGRERIAGINNAAELARTQYVQSREDARHSTPAGGAGGANGRGPGGLTRNEAFLRAQGLATRRVDGEIETTMTTPEIIDLADKLYDDTYAPPPPPRTTTTAPKREAPSRLQQITRGLGRMVEGLSPAATQPTGGAAPTPRTADRGGDVDLNGPRRGSAQGPSDAEVSKYLGVLTDAELLEEGVPQEQITRLRGRR